MAEITITVEHVEGLHAHPASLFVQEAQKYQSTITVINKDSTANAKSMLGILTLGVHQGTEITITADGDDATEALNALEQLILSNFAN